MAKRVFRPFGLVLLMAASVAGGAEKWEKPGATAQEFDATRASCQGQAYSQVPPMMEQVQISAGYVTPRQTQCTGYGYSVNCFTTGGQYVAPVFMSVDRNESGRRNVARSCLYGAGWRPAQKQ